MIDFSLTEEQELLLESIDEFIESCGFDEAYFRKCYEEGRAPTEYNEAVFESGIGRIGLPEEFDGTPCDVMTTQLVKERFYSKGFPFTSVMLQVDDLNAFGNEEQKKQAFEHLKHGKVAFALGITEPQAGSDNSAIAATATRKDGKVYLNGHKSFITGADTAPYILFVTRDFDIPDPHKAMTMWWVPSDKPGITIAPMPKIGCYLDGHMCEIYFDNVEVEEKDIFGKKDGGFFQLLKNFEVERLSIATASLGMAQCAYNDALNYANQRVQFGQQIGRFQLVQELLCQMRIKIDNMRSQIYRCAWLKDNKKSIQIESGLTKLYCAQAGFEVCDSAMQIMGGIGYTEDSRISRFWRDSRMHRIGGGTDQVCIYSAGRALLKEAAKKAGK